MNIASNKKARFFYFRSVHESLLNSLNRGFENSAIPFIESAQSIGGGSINEAFKLQTNAGNYFTKLNKASLYPNMFRKEKEGLGLLLGANSIKVPVVINLGEFEDNSFLLLEYIEKGNTKPQFWKQFAESLAKLHRNTSENFGLHESNYIGSLIQQNNYHDNWSEFFVEERLEPMVKLARDEAKVDSTLSGRFERLYSKLSTFFPEEKPALLHGDLWSGNFMCDASGDPVIFDPAVYYGHREMDIAMSKLFGGFSNDFYFHYNEVFPLESGWQERLDVANLYPLLVHVNLFGGSYVRDVEAVLRRFS